MIRELSFLKLVLALTAAVSLLAIVGCEGDEMDDDGIEDAAEQVEDNVEDAAEEAEEGMEDMGEDIEDGVDEMDN